jgi:SAM-dependent methyltransferase
MNTDREVSRHYGGGNLLSRLNAALAEDGIDPDHPSMEALAPYDQFHGRGLEATIEVANLVRATASDHILDIGSGIGGPARYFANRFGCRVTGIDLTPEFCDLARHFTAMLMDREIASQATANVSRGFSEARIIPIEVLARKPTQASPVAERDPA